MKKKILAIAMTAIVAALGLTGCNNGMGINDDGTYTWKGTMLTIQAQPSRKR